MTFEVIRKADGSYGWQLRDERGEIVETPRPGEIMLPPDPVRTKRSRQAVQEMLRQHYETQQAAKA